MYGIILEMLKES